MVKKKKGLGKKEMLSRRFLFWVFFIIIIMLTYYPVWQFLLALIGAGWLANHIADILVVKV